MCEGEVKVARVRMKRNSTFRKERICHLGCQVYKKGDEAKRQTIRKENTWRKENKFKRYQKITGKGSVR